MNGHCRGRENRYLNGKAKEISIKGERAQLSLDILGNSVCYSLQRDILILIYIHFDVIGTHLDNAQTEISKDSSYVAIWPVSLSSRILVN